MEDVDPQLRWKVFEGACEESLHRIRSHVALKLNIEPSYIYHKRNKHQFTNIRHEELFSIQRRLNNLKKLGSDIELVNKLDKPAEDSNFLK